MQVKHIQILVISFVALVSCLAVSFVGAKENSALIESVKKVVIVGSPSQSDHLDFDWSVYEDPSRPEFWDNATPPRPLRHLAAYPSIENAKKVKRWLSLQFEVMAKVTKVLEEIEAPSTKQLLSAASSSNPVDLANLTKAMGIEDLKDLKDIKIVNIYSSKCPACKKSQDVIAKLEKLGVEIVHLQTDYKEGNPLHDGSREYTKEFRDRFPHTVTPTLYIKSKDSDVEMIEKHVPFGPLYAHLSKLSGGA